VSSNGCALLVADVSDTTLTAIVDTHVLLNLGHTVATRHVIPTDVLATLVDTLRTLVAAAKENHAEAIRIVATATIRAATNRDVVVSHVTEATGVTMTVLSVTDESRYALHAASVLAAPHAGLRQGVLLETRGPKVRMLGHTYRRHVTGEAIGSRVSIRHLLTDDTHGSVPTDVVGRLAAFDDDMALVIDRQGELHIIATAMILASRVIPAHPRRAPEPAVGTKDQPVVRTAARAVIVVDNKVLLVAHHPQANRTVWTAPGGGCDKDETLTETVHREVREELGVDIHVGDILFEHVAEFAFRGVWLRQHETWFATELAGEFQPSDAPLNDAATSQVRAFSGAELLTEHATIAPHDLASRIKDLLR